MNAQPRDGTAYAGSVNEDPVAGFQEIKGHIQTTLDRHADDIIEAANGASKLAGQVGSSIESYQKHVEGMGDAMKQILGSGKKMHAEYGELLKLDMMKDMSKADKNLVAKAEHAAAELRNDHDADSKEVAEKYADLAHRFATDEDGGGDIGGEGGGDDSEAVVSETAALPTETAVSETAASKMETTPAMETEGGDEEG